MKYIFLIILFASCKKSKPSMPVRCYVAYDALNKAITDTFPRSSSAQFPNGYSIDTVKYCVDKTLDYVNDNPQTWPPFLIKYNIKYFGN